MRRTNKDILVMFTVIIAVLSMAFAANTIIKSEKLKRAFEKEMAFRLDIEERVTKLRAEKLELTNTLKSRDIAIKKLEAKNILLETNFTTQESQLEKLQDELRTITLLKDKLEQGLKEELAKQAP